MEKTQQKHLVYSIIGFLIISAYAIISFSGSYADNRNFMRSFSVTGEGEVVAVPDIAQFSFSVTTEGGKDIASLQEENSNKMNKAIEFIKDNNVEEKDIKTQNYNISPRYQYYNCNRPYDSVAPCPPAEIVGYTISQTIMVKVRNIPTAGDLLAGVVTNGANSVSQLSFTIDDPEEFKKEAREEAIKKAQKKAKELARTSGFKIGELISINESSYSPNRYLMATDMEYGIGGGMDLATAKIEPGSQDVTVNVTLRYEIK